MNEEELKEVIVEISTKMVTDNQAVLTTTVTTEEKPITTYVTKMTEIEEGLIPDITGADLRKQLLLKDAIDPEALLKMKAFLPARPGVGRVGTRYTTSSTLRLRANHAVAQDATFSDVSEDLVKEMNFISTETICNSKDEYLARPDHGRQLDEEDSEIIRKDTTPKARIQMVVGDSFSSAAIEANIKEVLPAAKQGLDIYNLDFDNIVFVECCCMLVMDKIGEVADADVVCLLIGERPGLATAEPISAYIAYKPTAGVPEAWQTIISNIHKGGIPVIEAGAHIAEIIRKMLDKKKSGIDSREAE